MPTIAEQITALREAITAKYPVAAALLTPMLDQLQAAVEAEDNKPPPPVLVELKRIGFRASDKRLQLGYAHPGVQTRLWKDGKPTGTTDTDGTIYVLPHVTAATYQVKENTEPPEQAKPVTTELHVRADGTGGATPGGEPIPEPPPPLVEVKAPVMLNTAGAALANARLTSTNPDAKGVTVDAADVVIRNLRLDGPHFRYGLFLRPGCKNLRVLGLSAGEKIRGDYLYDNSGGRAENVFIDLMGAMLPGSLQENGFRIHCRGFTLRGGRNAAGEVGGIQFYDKVTSPDGKLSVKAGFTVQDGSGDVVIEDIEITGAMGFEAIKTSAGWQTEPITKINGEYAVIVRRLTNAKGRDITIGNAVESILFENVAWHQFDPRPLFNLADDNPNFAGKKPLVVLRNCTFTGGSMLFDNKNRIRLTVENTTYNGQPVM